MSNFLKENAELLEKVRTGAGINSIKVEKTVSDYLQIARDNQLNYNELLQVLTLTKESVLQSLNKLSISALPETTSDTAKV